ncbi:histone-lysine N-trimethyltransferase SMYD5 isoform X1 [Leptidea sinapis]|uniref:histone-lysine N-trimethyltransferase SMYD5 isoform X1 n=1 Tax=Leptidea sinapis TaxID=189913 RepID=UPI002123D9C2|nr:histone-lysine N-trimethyltransferase SMYD5 isoform X1 [Leptidea sinapis]
MTGYEVRNTNGKKGKGLFAIKQFNKGDVILEEDPLVSCQFAWNAAYRYMACDYCMRPLETPEQNVRRLAAKPDIVLPHAGNFEADLMNVNSCGQCESLYCCEDCKQRAYNSYHRLLCYDQADARHPIHILLEAWKQMHYPPETTNILLLVRILAFIKQHPDPASAAGAIKQFCHRTVNEDAELVHKMLGEQFTDQMKTLRELTASVISGDVVEDFLTPEGFCTMMALIGTNGQGIGTSPLAQWVSYVTELPMSDVEQQQMDLLIDKIYKDVENESGQFLNTEGSGLFVLQSACNHSCAPNAESTFPYGNHRVQLKALKTIMPGDEIFISYLDECTLQRSRHSRQKELAENYLFMCWCERCTSETTQPDVTSEEEMSDEDCDCD